MPPGITDKDYVIAQYDGAIAYMDACIQTIFTALEGLGILDDTIVAINGDHGETLYDHECWFDHHGIYDVTLHVPLILRYPKPRFRRACGSSRLQPAQGPAADPARAGRPGSKAKIDWPGDKRFDGHSLMALVRGEEASFDSEFYITECTWMRKHGWRTPEWKLIRALEPDFHFKPEVELYNLVRDPDENENLAESEPEMVALLDQPDGGVDREARGARPASATRCYTQGDWHGHKGVGPFKTSQQAYDTMHIGSVRAGSPAPGRQDCRQRRR